MVQVVGWAYESDYHCVDCTAQRFGPSDANDDYECVYDSEGNPLYPIFDIDEFEFAAYCGSCLGMGCVTPIDCSFVYASMDDYERKEFDCG